MGLKDAGIHCGSTGLDERDFSAVRVAAAVGWHAGARGCRGGAEDLVVLPATKHAPAVFESFTQKESRGFRALFSTRSCWT